MQGSDCQVAVSQGSPQGGGGGGLSGGLSFPSELESRSGGGPTVLVSQTLQLSRGFAENGEKTRALSW